MRLTQYLLPTAKETPSEAVVASHRLMLRAGMIHKTASGIYSWLPLGVRVLRNIERIVREEQNRAGAQEVILPTIQPADLWRESGRYDAYGAEMLRIKDRHERDMLYGPTAEEVITDIFRNHIFSYRDLPKMLYQIHWKFRDEIRPRFGVMRGREFHMKDCYSFDLEEKGAAHSYRLMFEAYLRTFLRMGLKAVPVKADTGPIGGDLSHEFHVIAATGESLLYYDAQLDTLAVGDTAPEKLMTIYAAAEEMHNPALCPIPSEQLKIARGIEVGHIFYLGTKYSEALKARVTDADGNLVTVHMGCYGIGVSRLAAAIIEAHHDEAGIIWPQSIAPFQVGLINLRQDDAACGTFSEQAYQALQEASIECLYDDRDERAGAKFADMDLIGLPWQIIVGPRGLQAASVELKCRQTGERQVLSLESAINHISKKGAC